ERRGAPCPPFESALPKNGGHGAARCSWRSCYALRAPLPTLRSEQILALASYSIVIQPSFVSPRFGRAWGLPVSFPFPPKRGGVARQSRRQEENAPVQRATGFSRFRVPRCPDQSQPLVAGGVLPGSARGCSCEPPPGVPPPPHLHDAS